MKEALKNTNKDKELLSTLVDEVLSFDYLNSEAKMMTGIACYYLERQNESILYMNEAIKEKPEKNNWKEYYNKIIKKMKNE